MLSLIKIQAKQTAIAVYFQKGSQSSMSGWQTGCNEAV
jgi:hypothetical protein